MIICAAIKDTRTGVVFCGIRHGDIYCTMRDAKYYTSADKTIEGFVDNRNNSHNRHEAFIHALQFGQLPSTVIQYKQAQGETELYSEDLY